MNPFPILTLVYLFIHLTWAYIFVVNPLRHPFPSTQVCALVVGLFDPVITPRLLPAVDNRVTVVVTADSGRCLGTLLFSTFSGSMAGSEGRTSGRRERQSDLFPRYVSRHTAISKGQDGIKPQNL